MFLIHLKEPKCKSHSFEKRAMLVVWYVLDSLNRTNSKESLVPKSDFTGFTEFSFRKETTVSDI